MREKVWGKMMAEHEGVHPGKRKLERPHCSLQFPGKRLVRSLLPIDKARGNRLELQQGRFIQESSFMERVVPPWHSLPGDFIPNYPPKKPGCGTWRRSTVVTWWRWLDLMIPKVFFNLDLSMERGEEREIGKGNGEGTEEVWGDKRGVRVGREMRDKLVGRGMK